MTETSRPLGSSALSPKLRSWHRERNAIVYVRQSTPQQVIDHQESTARQYALADRALQLGWLPDQVQVIDEDLGRSGQSIEGRPGFQRLLAEVALNQVGLILGLEMSRLARSCRDWHHLLELCARYRTLLADGEGVYDPTDYNDRLLLGLTGIMNEAELHVIKERMYQGKVHKARRGELVIGVPVGYLKQPSGEVVLDPDEQVQAVVRLIFDEFDRQGTVHGVLRYLIAQGIRLPIRLQTLSKRGQLEWRQPARETLRHLLLHPIYAGVYSYGYRPVDPARQQPGRRSTGRLSGSLNNCLVFLKERLPAYISWERYEANQQRLAANRARAESPGAVRQGPALLAGIVWCGRCGRRMYARYSGRRARLWYVCSTARSDYGLPLCQSLAGEPLDRLVTEQLLQALLPAALEASVTAVAEVEQQRVQLSKHWRQRQERAAYEVARAHRQYEAVEPENRLVARELERRWEKALEEQRRLEDEFARFERSQPRRLTKADALQIQQLAEQVPALWQAATTTPADRSQVARLLLDKVVVTVDPGSERVQVRLEWAGGLIREHMMERTVRSYKDRSDYAQLVARLTQWHQEGLSPKEMARKLNASGFHPANRGRQFEAGMVRRLLADLKVRPRVSRCPACKEELGKEEWWLAELAGHLGISPHTLHGWRRKGWLRSRQLGGRGGPWAVWANAAERERLRRLRSCPRTWRNRELLAELRSPQEPG